MAHGGIGRSGIKEKNARRDRPEIKISPALYIVKGGESILKQQCYGVEIELTGITRKEAAKVLAELFGTIS